MAPLITLTSFCRRRQQRDATHHREGFIDAKKALPRDMSAMKGHAGRLRDAMRTQRHIGAAAAVKINAGRSVEPFRFFFIYSLADKPVRHY